MLLSLSLASVFFVFTPNVSIFPHTISELFQYTHTPEQAQFA